MTERLPYSAEQLQSYGIQLRSGFMVRDTSFGPTVLLVEGSARETADFMRREQLHRLEINHALGYAGVDITCLENFPFLAGLEIIHRTISDISAIHELELLEDLSIQTHCETPIDFARFPRLHHCRVYWRAGAQSVFACGSLRSLFLDYYKPAEVKALKHCSQLHSLTITNSPLADLTPLSSLTALEELDLTNLSRLVQLDPISHLPRLKKLAIDGSKQIQKIEPLRALKDLQTLYLCNVGSIPTISPLRHMSRLESLYAWEDTNIEDGDLSILLALPSLKTLAMRSRRHYSPTVADIERHIAHRNAASH